ncbi:DUF1971 domain-containing protein [Denitrobaculum tricleocarpae]|uniref:DUF1971 domain-containing protein n=1 Tax=Denitrobaculum tricleocarpae TaxID=2591009 RepID=A0A545TKX0_9PROT|nr:DUF1971 domain-containing protein [Denitrobaculum tricleocarpae]TQV77872.1 DUF1971 domain-containing protein [Denitrobaculum tricleocarpae]
MKELPEGLVSHKRTADFTETTIPLGLLKDHQTKAGVWGLIQVTAGRLRYSIPSRGEEIPLRPGVPGVVEPEVPHRVTPEGSVAFHVEFYSAPLEGKTTT